MHLPIIDLTPAFDAAREIAPIYETMMAEGWPDLAPECVVVTVEAL